MKNNLECLNCGKKNSDADVSPLCHNCWVQSLKEEQRYEIMTRKAVMSFLS